MRDPAPRDRHRAERGAGTLLGQEIVAVGGVARVLHGEHDRVRRPVARQLTGRRRMRAHQGAVGPAVDGSRYAAQGLIVMDVRAATTGCEEGADDGAEDVTAAAQLHFVTRRVDGHVSVGAALDLPFLRVDPAPPNLEVRRPRGRVQDAAARDCQIDRNVDIGVPSTVVQGQGPAAQGHGAEVVEDSCQYEVGSRTDGQRSGGGAVADPRRQGPQAGLGRVAPFGAGYDGRRRYLRSVSRDGSGHAGRVERIAPRAQVPLHDGAVVQRPVSVGHEIAVRAGGGGVVRPEPRIPAVGAAAAHAAALLPEYRPREQAVGPAEALRRGGRHGRREAERDQEDNAG